MDRRPGSTKLVCFIILTYFYFISGGQNAITGNRPTHGQDPGKYFFFYEGCNFIQ